MQTEKSLGERKGFVYGYMCLTDWEFEAPFSGSGNHIYYDLESLKNRGCIEHCGSVKVKISFVETIQEGI